MQNLRKLGPTQSFALILAGFPQTLLAYPGLWEGRDFRAFINYSYLLIKVEDARHAGLSNLAYYTHRALTI